MNMHGIMAPAELQTRRFRRRPLDATWAWVRDRRMFMLVVVLPTVLLASYLFLVASDQYESEAHFLVRSSQSAAATSGAGVSAALSLVTGGAADASQSEAMSVADYLTSHDAVDALRRRDGLVERFARPDVDIVSRLASDPTPEKLLKYYRRQVSVKYNTDTGITVLKVHSFRPRDSYELVSRLLQLGERRVNALNVRSYDDSMKTARAQLAEAEDNLAAVQGRLTSFRQNRRDIDPQASGQAQIGLVSTLTGQLSAARAQLNAMGAMIGRSSPQYQAVASRVAALEAQVASQRGRLTGGNTAIAADISGYEGLQLRQQFLAKRYEAAAASLDRARDQAIRQQLYLVRVVDANVPVKALYPERWRILLTAAIVLLIAYSIGWLIVAGVREHAA